MIGKYKNFKFAVFQIVVPSVKDFNYSQKFLVLSFVSNLCQNHFPRKKSYGVLLARF